MSAPLDFENNKSITEWARKQVNPGLIIAFGNNPCLALRDCVTRWTFTFKFRGVSNMCYMLDLHSLPENFVTVALASDAANVNSEEAVSILYQQESESFFQLLLLFSSPNARHFLDYADLRKADVYTESFPRIMDYWRCSGYDGAHCCIDSGGSLAAYGIRPSTDIDFISLEDESDDVRSPASAKPQYDNHNAMYDDLFQCGAFALDRYTLINDPASTFCYKGLKFLSLPLVKIFKENRRLLGVHTLKDRLDIRLIENHLKAAKKGRVLSSVRVSFLRVMAKYFDIRFNTRLLSLKHCRHFKQREAD